MTCTGLPLAPTAVRTDAIHGRFIRDIAPIATRVSVLVHEHLTALNNLSKGILLCVNNISVARDSVEHDAPLESANTLSQHQIVIVECTGQADWWPTSPTGVCEILARQGYEAFEPIAYLCVTEPPPKDCFVERTVGDHDFFQLLNN